MIPTIELNRVKKLSFLLSILIFINIFFGPLVRATDSGLACPDWPLCYGKVLPPPEFRIWMEVGHRIYSGILGLIYLVLFVYIVKHPFLRKSYATLGVLGSIVLINQVILGKLTVTMLLNPKTVNLHLLNAVLYLLVVFSITLKSNAQLNFQNKDLSLRKLFFKIWNPGISVSFLLFLSIYFQLFMGGRVSSNYAGLACPDWPTCHGVFFPSPMEGQIRFQIEHRFLAYILFLGVLYLMTLIKKTYSTKSPEWKLSILFFFSLTFQITLGVINVLFHLPILITALHTANGVLVLLVSYTLFFQQKIKSQIG
ncbi:MAG: COX15/CtaA family protein [Leptospiraceae bacterium]|nr:COX15/CtaA family protein [Leptospiraceae bacterium]MCP5512811.1 COX15/CtaA family protein [Leptospiraceae bacterium]